MFQVMMTWCLQRSGLVFCIALAFGLFFQKISAFFNPSISWLLMAVIALGFIKMDLAATRRELRSWGYQIWLLVLSLFIIPLVLYGAVELVTLHFPSIHHAFSIATLVLFGTSTAVIAPTLAMLYGGHYERAMLSLMLSSVWVALTLPLLLLIVQHQSINFPFHQMLFFLLRLIVLPFIVAMAIRLFLPKLKKAVLPHVSSISQVLIIPLCIGGVSGMAHYFATSFGLILWIWVISSLCFILAFILGWVLAFKSSHEDKLTSAIINTWVNSSLTVVVANEFFKHHEPKAILFCVIACIPWAFSISVLGWVSNKLKR